MRTIKGWAVVVAIIALFVLAGNIELAGAACNTQTYQGCTYAQKMTIRGDKARAQSYARDEARKDRAMLIQIEKIRAKALRRHTRKCSLHYHHLCGY